MCLVHSAVTLAGLIECICMYGRGDRNWMSVPTRSMMSMIVWPALRTASSDRVGMTFGLARLATSSAMNL